MTRLTFKIDFADEHQKLAKLPYRNFSLIQLSDKSVIPIDPNQAQKLHFDYSYRQHILSNKTTLLVGRYLIKCQNLTTLVVEVDFGNLDTTVKIDFPNLTHLKSSVSVLPVIQSHKVKFLYLTRGEGTWNRQKSLNLSKFIVTCSELKHLTYSGFWSNQICKLKNHLESLELRMIFDLSLNSKPLFESQKASLKYLSLDVYKIDDNITDFIYHEMNLEKLMDRRMEWGEMNKLKDIAIKNLALNNDKENFTQRLYPHCHNLEKLSINIVRMDGIRLISRLPKLKHLKLRRNSFGVKIEENLQFPQLEELILPEKNSHNYFNMVCGSSKLKRLGMAGDISVLSDFHIILECCPDIEEIDVGVIEDLTEDMSETLKIAASKVNVKCQVTKVDDFDKLVQLKSRLIVSLKTREYYDDPFSLELKKLGELHADINDYYHFDSSCYRNDYLDDLNTGNDI